MRQINDTFTIGDLIENSVFSEMKDRKMGSVVKHSTIFSFWDDVVGSKFAKFTRPYALKGNKLYVSAKSPVIVQELTLYKNKLIQKANSYSKPLGIELTDIIFNYKNFAAQAPSGLTGVEDKPVEIYKHQLDSVEVDNQTKEQIQKNINKIKFLNQEQKEKLTTKIISTYQAKVFQDN